MLQEFFTRPAAATKCYLFHVRGSITLAETPTDTFFGNLLQSNTCMSELCLHDSNDELCTAVATALQNDPGAVLGNLTVTLRETGLPGGNAMLLQALQRNSSLWQVTADHKEGWSEADLATMQFYAQRNKIIHAILEAPINSVRALLTQWPQILLDIQGCEMEASIDQFLSGDGSR